MVFGNIFNRLFNRQSKSSPRVGSEATTYRHMHTTVSSIQRTYGLIFTDYQKENYEKEIIDIFNGHRQHITGDEMLTITDIDLLLIYSAYHRTVTTNDAEIRKIYYHLMDLKDESAHIAFSKYLLKMKRNIESENVLELAITNLDSKHAKYLLANRHLIDGFRFDVGLEMLDELAFVGYFPAIYDIIYYYNEHEDIPSKNVQKYIWLPYELDDDVFENNKTFAKRMEVINCIMHRHCYMPIICKNVHSLKNPNKYAKLLMSDEFVENKTKSVSLCSDESDASK
jgi:hypothetical protein